MKNPTSRATIETQALQLKKALHDAWMRIHFIDKSAQLCGDISKRINWASDGLEFAHDKANAVKEAKALLAQINNVSADNSPIQYMVSIHSIETI